MFTIFIYLKNIVNYFIFLFLSRFFNGTDEKCFDRLLLVNTGQIGDLVISSLFLNSSSRKPQLYLLINKKYAELFSAYEGPVNIIEVDLVKYKYSIAHRFRILNQLNGFRFKYVVNISTGRGPINDEISLLSGAEMKFTLLPNYSYTRRILEKSYNKKYSYVLGNKHQNEYEKQSFVLKHFYNQEDWSRTHIYLSEKIEKESLYKLGELGISPNEYITVSPFSDWKIKNWSRNKFQELFELILCNTKMKLVLLGDQKKRKLLDGFTKLDRGRVINTAGKFSIIESAAILKNANLFIGNDSGFTHIAKSLGKPFIGLIGGGAYNKFFPYHPSSADHYFYYEMDCFGCDWNCKYDKPYCLANIKVNDVFNRIMQLIQ